MIKLHLLKKAIIRDIDDIKQQLCNASGINPKSTQRPHGFCAVASFNFGDIYIDDFLNSQLGYKLQEEIDVCLTKFLKDDYGNITIDEKDDNIENRYFGDGDIIGRYHISLGTIEIIVLKTHTEIKKIH